MNKTIISLINDGLKVSIADEVTYSFIRKLFKLRYNTGIRSLNKFSFIGSALGRGTQTIRLSIIKTWENLPNIEAITSEVSEIISEKMIELKVTSIHPSKIAGVGLFSGMTESDVLTLVHDMNSYACNGHENHIFMVRKHGQCTLSVGDKIDLLATSEKQLIQPTPLHPKSFGAVHLAKNMDGSGSISEDITILSNATRRHVANILLDRIGITGDEGCHTLATIGNQYSVTRERIRQVTIGLIRQIISVESIALSGPITSLKNICENVDFKGNNFISLKELIDDNAYLSCFSGNEKGLFILMSAAGIRNIIQNSGFFIHHQNISKDHGIYAINIFKSGKLNKIKAVKIPEHKQMMAVMPLTLINVLKKRCVIDNLSANFIYMKTLENFCLSNPSELPANDCEVLWDELGNTWRMINIRLTKKMITEINGLSAKLGVSRASLVYAVMKKELKPI